MSNEQTEGTSSVARSAESLHQPLSPEELRELGEGILDAIATLDLAAAVQEQVQLSGQNNPNRLADGLFFGIKPDGLPMSDTHVYRNVDARAIDDLIKTGVVRGAFTATGGARANTNGHSAYWSRGRSTSTHNLNPGHFVLETPTEHAEAGWVTADKLTGVYTRDNEGAVHNIVRPDHKD